MAAKWCGRPSSVDAKGKFFDQFKTSCILYFFTHDVIRLGDMGAVYRVESKLKRLIYTFKKWNSISLMIVFVQNSNLLQWTDVELLLSKCTKKVHKQSKHVRNTLHFNLRGEAFNFLPKHNVCPFKTLMKKKIFRFQKI